MDEPDEDEDEDEDEVTLISLWIGIPSVVGVAGVSRLVRVQVTAEVQDERIAQPRKGAANPTSLSERFEHITPKQAQGTSDTQHEKPALAQRTVAPKVNQVCLRSVEC